MMFYEKEHIEARALRYDVWVKYSCKEFDKFVTP